MSYRIEQKNGNKIYVYEATNHWDPKKKRAQQTRVYLGVKDPRTGEILTPRKDKWKKTQNFTCGVTYAIEKSMESNHLREILEQEFGPEDGGQIFPWPATARRKAVPCICMKTGHIKLPVKIRLPGVHSP